MEIASSSPAGPAPGSSDHDARPPVRPANRAENGLTLLGGVWLVIGLFVDGFAHSGPISCCSSGRVMLILTTPLRAAWFEPSDRRGWADLGGPIASAATAAALLAFFFTYAFGISNTGPQRVRFDPVTDANELFVEVGLGSAYIATAIIVIPVLGLLRRWDLPPGAVTLVWTVPVLLENLAFDGNRIALPAVVVGGVAADLGRAAFGRLVDRRHALVGSMAVGVVTLWSVWMALLHATGDVGWVAELWLGQIVMSGLVAVGLALLAFPPERPAAR